MNDTAKIWILTGLVFVIGGVLIFLSKWFFNQMLLILREIREELKRLTNITTVQDIKIENLIKDGNQGFERLNRHANRIMDIEKQILIIHDKIK